MIKIAELVEYIEKESKKNKISLPQYIDVQDINDSRIFINGKWTTQIAAWGICPKDDKWIYFQTDEERGYICGIQKYDTESEACEGVLDILLTSMKSKQSGNSQRDNAVRYIVNTSSHSKEESEDIVDSIEEHEDIFEEMYNYMRYKEYGVRGKKVVGVEGFTAEKLVKEEGFTPTAAYRFLVKLSENAEKAKKELEEGTAEMK